MVSLLWHHREHIQQIVCITCFVVALARGASPERIMAGTLLAALIANVFYDLGTGESQEWRYVELGRSGIDLAFLATFAVTATQANRIYPLWIGAAQIIAVLAHCYGATLEQINQVALAMMSILPSYIQLAAMVVGLVCHVSRRAKLGSYPSWRDDFLASRHPT